MYYLDIQREDKIENLWRHLWIDPVGNCYMFNRVLPQDNRKPHKTFLTGDQYGIFMHCDSVWNDKKGILGCKSRFSNRFHYKGFWRHLTQSQAEGSESETDAPDAFHRLTTLVATFSINDRENDSTLANAWSPCQRRTTFCMEPLAVSFSAILSVRNTRMNTNVVRYPGKQLMFYAMSHATVTLSTMGHFPMINLLSFPSKSFNTDLSEFFLPRRSPASHQHRAIWIHLWHITICWSEGCDWTTRRNALSTKWRNQCWAWIIHKYRACHGIIKICNWQYC